MKPYTTGADRERTTPSRGSCGNTSDRTRTASTCNRFRALSDTTSRDHWSPQQPTPPRPGARAASRDDSDGCRAGPAGSRVLAALSCKGGGLWRGLLFGTAGRERDRLREGEPRGRGSVELPPSVHRHPGQPPSKGSHQPPGVEEGLVEGGDGGLLPELRTGVIQSWCLSYGDEVRRRSRCDLCTARSRRNSDE